jgi:hypothetical protein
VFRAGGEFGVEVVREDPGGVLRLVAVAFTVADCEAIVASLNRSAEVRWRAGAGSAVAEQQAGR